MHGRRPGHRQRHHITIAVPVRILPSSTSCAGYRLQPVASIDLLAKVSRLLADKAIADFTVARTNLNRRIGANPILVTALNPIHRLPSNPRIPRQPTKPDARG